jgi:hypothetical protein
MLKIGARSHLGNVISISLPEPIYKMARKKKCNKKFKEINGSCSNKIKY